MNHHRLEEIAASLEFEGNWQKFYPLLILSNQAGQAIFRVPADHTGMRYCVAGLALLKYGEIGHEASFGYAADLLELTQDQAEKLFLNKGNFITNKRFSEITVEDAAMAVRKLMLVEGSLHGKKV